MAVGKQVTRKRLEYWSKVYLEPWMQQDIVPVQTINDTHPRFDKVVEEVKARRYQYRVINTVEEIVEEG